MECEVVGDSLQGGIWRSFTHQTKMFWEHLQNSKNRKIPNPRDAFCCCFKKHNWPGKGTVTLISKYCWWFRYPPPVEVGIQYSSLVIYTVFYTNSRGSAGFLNHQQDPIPGTQIGRHFGFSFALECHGMFQLASTNFSWCLWWQKNSIAQPCEASIVLWASWEYLWLKGFNCTSQMLKKISANSCE